MRTPIDWLTSDHAPAGGVARALSSAVSRLRRVGFGLDDERRWWRTGTPSNDFTFIERFAAVGIGGLLILMAGFGIYGFASLLGVEPKESLVRIPGVDGGEGRALDSDRPTGAADNNQLYSPQESPSLQGQTPGASRTPSAISENTGVAPVPEAIVRREEARAISGGTASSPQPTNAAGQAATPAPPPTSPPPTPLPEQPTPTAIPAECAPGAPQVSEHGNQVQFVNSTVVSFQEGVPGILVVDVGGIVLTLVITGGTEVRGVLGAATVVSGQAHRSNDGSLIAQLVEVVCPESAR